MQDHELNQDELGGDLETDEFQFETGEDFAGELEGPEDELEMRIADAVRAAIAPFRGNASGSIFSAGARLAQQAAAPRRPKSGRWLRRGNKIVLLGV